MHSRSLLAQVVAINLLLVAVTVLVATLVIDAHLHSLARGREALVFGLAIVATLLGNWLLLRRRFDPLDRLISSMEGIDLAAPQPPAKMTSGIGSADVRRLEAAFDRMIARLEAERREAGRAAIRAQERERQRIAQDLHDEVNQALTAVSLRLQASIEHAPEELRSELAETKRLSGQAMQELLAIAHQLRPAVLDDHGLTAALDSQVRQFADQTEIDATFTVDGSPPALTPEEQLVLYRVTQESLSNIAQHAGAQRVEVQLSFNGSTVLRIADDGRGFTEARPGGLGLPGMRERALLVGGQLSVRSGDPGGTQVELTLA
ncbi:MAG: sensor histidine kinase [Solirubrobacterales bacterium]|nr:sensor histidine kinase [Solirubrobacterales bacterium]